MIEDKFITKRFTSIVFGAKEPVFDFLPERGQIESIIKLPEFDTEEEGITITSMPSQMVVELNPAGVRFVDRSEVVPCRVDFPNVVIQFVKLLVETKNMVMVRLGFSFNVYVGPLNSRPAGEVILDRLIKKEGFCTTGYDLKSASVNLWYVAHDIGHRLEIKPKDYSLSEKIYHCRSSTSFNISGGIPDDKSLEKTMKEEYLELKSVISKCLVE